MKAIIITGTSQGIGEALANQLLNEAHHICCISRTSNPKLIERAEQSSNKLSYFPFDLTRLNEIDQLLAEVFAAINAESKLDAIYLINNAGMLSPVAPIELNSATSIIENVQLNLLAPMIITSNFIRLTQEMNIDKRIMNISSASAKYLLPAQSCYSTAKAGLDSFSKSVNLEQSGKAYPVKVAAVYPGMIDTQLQAEIRSTSSELFPYVEQFKQLAEAGKLQTPDYTAEKLIEILFRHDYGSNALIEEL